MQEAVETISLNGKEGQKIAEDNYSVMGRREKAINIEKTAARKEKIPSRSFTFRKKCYERIHYCFLLF